LDRNPYAKAVGGYVALLAGNVAGVPRGAVNIAKDAADGLTFLQKVTDPLDVLKSPPGESALAQLVDTGRAVVDYGRSVKANPSRVVDDVERGAKNAYADLVPSATPTADTFVGEVRRMYGIGQNQGELALNIATLPVGGEALGPLRTLRGASRLRSATRYLEDAGHLDAVARLNQPYKGMGHHVFVKRDADFWKILGGRPIPKFIVDHPLNVVQFKGLTQGEGYALHASIDKDAKGFGLPKKMRPRGWSAKKAGIDTQTGFDRVWNGTPEAMKTAIGGAGGGVGGYIREAVDEDETW
jgi:hypothetical protein